MQARKKEQEEEEEGLEICVCVWWVWTATAIGYSESGHPEFWWKLKNSSPFSDSRGRSQQRGEGSKVAGALLGLCIFALSYACRQGPGDVNPRFVLQWVWRREGKGRASSSGSSCSMSPTRPQRSAASMHAFLSDGLSLVQSETHFPQHKMTSQLLQEKHAL